MLLPAVEPYVTILVSSAAGWKNVGLTAKQTSDLVLYLIFHRLTVV